MKSEYLHEAIIVIEAHTAKTLPTDKLDSLHKVTMTREELALLSLATMEYLNVLEQGQVQDEAVATLRKLMMRLMHVAVKRL